MIKEHDRIVLTTDVPKASLRTGDVGTIVHLYKDGKGCEVEFRERYLNPIYFLWRGLERLAG